MSFVGKLMRYRRLLLVVVVLLALILLFAKCVGDNQNEGNEAKQAAVQQGVSYLESLEAMGADRVETLLKEQRAQEIQALKDERLRQLESGEISVWSLFEDYVVLGDSRSCGFTFGGFLETNRVLAGYGDTIRKIETHIAEIEKINPSYIFICYGLNDIVQTGWETPETYAADFNQILDDLQTKFPDAKLFVNSIFKCYDPAFARWEKWREAPEYSAAVQAMCEEAGYYFIENENLDDSKADLWQDDGIHFIAEFYPIWGTNMIMEVYDSELQQTEDIPA